MAKKSIGVYQNEKGFWEYRFVVSINGQRIHSLKQVAETNLILFYKRAPILVSC